MAGNRRRIFRKAAAWIVIGLAVSGIFAAVTSTSDGTIRFPIVADADADELAGSLAAATQQQGVCYGWQLAVSAPDRVPHVERGSSAGAGTELDRAGCPQWVTLDATIIYTSESSEAEDSASIRIESSDPFSGLTGPAAAEGLGVTPQDLLGANDDVALINAVAALPLLAAERGMAPPVTLQPNTGPVPATDGPTGTPGSDYWRANGPFLVALTILIVLCLGGMTAVLVSLRRDRRRGARPPRPPDPVPFDLSSHST